MDPKKHPLTIVAELLNETRPTADGMYCLYVQHHELELCRCNLVPKDLPVIAHITGFDINVGPTLRWWNKVEDKIRIYLKEGVIEWQPQKP